MRLRWLGGRALVAAAAVGLTVALAQQPVQGSFTGSSTSSGNQVGAAASFCTTPGTSTVVAEADSFIDQANQPAVSGGTATYLVVTPQAGAVRRTLVRFPMPPIPARCEVTTATLRIFAESQTAARTLGAYQGNPNVPQWTEGTLNWTNQPATAGSPATAVMPNSDQYVEWTVTAIVRAIYAGPVNNGFVVRDQDETGPGAWQQFNSRSVAVNKPQLTVAWG
jgi:hypothetical protein